MAEGAESRNDDIRCIRNGPPHHDRLNTAVRIEFLEHLTPRNNFLCLFAEQGPRQAETDFNPDDFADPGDEDPRNEAEDDAVYRQEGNRRQTDGIDKGNQENTKPDGIKKELPRSDSSLESG